MGCAQREPAVCVRSAAAEAATAAVAVDGHGGVVTPPSATVDQLDEFLASADLDGDDDEDEDEEEDTT